jgi:curved DNA-binding protein
MAAGDYYDALGVEKQASTDQIKSAFRKLARKCHPDVAGDDPEAAEKFARIREAYETLVDPERRARYDRRGIRKQVRRREWRPPGGWGGFSTRARATSTRSKRQQSDIGLEDIFNDFGRDADFGFGGTEKKASKSERDTATGQQGPRNKVLPVEVPDRVARLGGAVSVRFERMRRSSDGVNAYPYKEMVDLKVPPRTCSGDVLTVPRMGDMDPVSGRYGDLKCRINVQAAEATEESTPPPQPPPRAPETEALAETRTVPVSFVEAILGSRIEIETSKGTVRIGIPPGSSSGTRLRLRGRGESGGDLFVVLKIMVPRDLDEESRTLIQRFAELNPVDPRAKEN